MAKFDGKKNTKDSKELEYTIKDVTLSILAYLQKKYPHLNFIYEKTISKEDIASATDIKISYTPENKRSHIKPDGGRICLIHGDEKLFVLSTEAKYQGTNDKRKKEGKPKQAMGNAIERIYKNFSEIKILCSKLGCFPYVAFIYGCDFHPGSSILDRLDALTGYWPRNVDYTLDKYQRMTVYVREKPFTYGEVYNKLKKISNNIVNYYIGVINGRGKNKRKKF